ncbi:MAG TPA: endonuclease/exonuclease/phosphatase family protein [Actinomycetota bacterium]|nr:endonuclease/exonuclease/phosphatase family protein [Actinomycetota bacterium]
MSIAHGSSHSVAERSYVRVVTLNLWGRRGHWKQRRRILADGLHELQPDLVAFIEAIKTDQYDQVIDLLGDGYHVAHQREREPGGDGDVGAGQGASIASRWPIRAVHEVDQSVTARTRGFAATTLVTDVAAPEPIGPLLFVNHVPNWQLDFENERELQAVRAARAVEDLIRDREIHVVFAGDFTADPDSASVRFLTGRQSLQGMSVCYRDAWESVRSGEPGETFTPSNPLMAERNRDWPFRRLDYILVRCGDHRAPDLDIQDCKLIFDQPVSGVWATDHFGVLADLAVPR